MMKVLALALCAPLVACTSGTSGDIPPGGDDDTMPPPDDGISGEIATNTTWMGSVRITGSVTIDPGVTVTIAPGTTVTMTGTAVGVDVNGIIDASGGTKAQPISILQSGYIRVNAGGSMTYSYVDQEGGGVHVSGTGMFTATDSKLSNAQGGDFLTMGGGTINVSYSTLGEIGGATSTHCNLHFDQDTNNTITVTHSNIGGAPYGVMFYGAVGADMTFNNWLGNQIDVSTDNYTVSGDFSNGYFALGMPTAGPNATLTFNTLATAMLTDAGPR